MNLKTFYQKLRYWSFHCSLNALPSFGIALFYLELRKFPEAAAAMICAIFTFVLLYAIFTTWMEPLRHETHVLTRALKIGTRIRAAISGVSTVMLIVPPALFFMPDTWCGILAIWALNFVSEQFSGPGSSISTNFANGGTMVTGSYRFFSTYAVTMMEGFIISFMLMTISFFAVIYRQSKDRKRAFCEAIPPSSKRV